MKTKKSTTLFSIKTLTQAVTIGLLAIGSEAAANSGLSNAGVRNVNNVSTSTARSGDTTTYQTIGDLEIYQAAQGSKTTIMMMLDISGSMTSRDGKACRNGEAPTAATYHLEDESGKKLTEIIADDGVTKIDISKGVKVITACPSAPTRVERLKTAMVELVHKKGLVDNKVSLGLGTYPTRYHQFAGSIFVPSRPLTDEQRWKLMQYAATLNPTGATPATAAYVEAGAYMLGTKTSNLSSTTEKRIFTVGRMTVDNGSLKLIQCASAPVHDVWNGSAWVPTATERYALGSDSYNWYQCNDPSSAEFPSFDFDMTTQSSSTRATIIPDRVNRLDFNLFPKFDVVVGKGLNSNYQWPIRRATNIPTVTVPTTADGWRTAAGQFSNDSYVFGETIEYRVPTIGNSGFPFSAPDTKKKDENGNALDTYEAGIQDPRKCDGYGIYFLTDGEPNNANSTVQESANMSLGKTGRYTPTVTESEFPNGTGQSTGFWTTIASYAKDLHNGNNPMGVTIKTATVGFGDQFLVNGKVPTVPGKTVMVAGEERPVVDCARLGSTDAKNLCKWGEYTYGYGEGGFLATTSAAEIKDSVVQFSQSLNQTISTAPAGTIAVPKDPLSIDSIQPYAYLPMIEPKVTEISAVWRGNLKKFHTLNGTLYGKDAKTRLYIKANNATTTNENYPSQFNGAAMDIWQEGESQGDNSAIDVGGAKSHIKNITASDKNSRFVYLENYHQFDVNAYNADRANYMKSIEGTKVLVGGQQVPNKHLVKVGVQNGSVVGLDQLKAPYNLDDKLHILNFLGVNIPLGSNATHNLTNSSTNEQIVSFANAVIGRGEFTNQIVLGGVVHSVPVLATFSGQFEKADADTPFRISSDEAKRDDTLLYGSMDGALHMVEAASGQERFAFIPRAVFDDTEQRNALLHNGTNTSRAGSPVFGVDAPWTVYADYLYQFSNEKGEPKNPATVTASKVYAYGGMRMGGNGIFGLDITDMRKGIGGVAAGAEPKLLFSINRYTPGFERLGQTWSKPLVAKIKTGSGVRDLRDVVIFGGGYDMCYEHPKFKVGLGESTHSLTNKPINEQTQQYTQYLDGETTCQKPMARGNAVYMVDAKTGELLGSWTNKDHPEMKDSVVGEITALDRNNNGAIDHLYFADLGGKVFRVDLKEGTTSATVGGGGGQFVQTRRVVKVLDANAGKANDPNHLNYRFYDQPLVSFYDNDDKTKSFAVVNIASGDRSSPVHTHRKVEDANLIFGIFDRDLTSTKLDRAVADPGLVTKDLTVDNLLKIDPKAIDQDPARVAVPDANGVVKGAPNKVAKGILDNLKAAVNSKTKTNHEGWYYEMIRFDGLTNISGLKAMGPGTVTGNVYYANIYSPSYEYTTSNSCSARVSGGTERQLYCLPWGVCATKDGAITTENGVLGYIKAGPGIQELAIGTVTNRAGTSSAFRAILGHQSLKEIADIDNSHRRAPDGGDRSAFSRLPSGSAPQGGSGTGADVYGQNIITSPQYTLAVQRWYDLQNEKQAN